MEHSAEGDTKFEKAFQLVVGDLSSGNINSGEQMPIHSEYAERVGCSDSVISQVYKRLADLGVIEHHQPSLHGSNMRATPGATILNLATRGEKVGPDAARALTGSALKCATAVRARPEFAGQGAISIVWHSLADELAARSQTGVSAPIESSAILKLFVPDNRRLALPKLSEPISRGHRRSQIFFDVTAAVFNGEWPPGFKTAPMADFAEQLGCRETLVADAFAELAAWRVIEPSEKAGIYRVSDLAAVVNVLRSDDPNVTGLTLRGCKYASSRIVAATGTSDDIYRDFLLEGLDQSLDGVAAIIAGRVVAQRIYQTLSPFGLIDFFNDYYEGQVLKTFEFTQALRVALLSGVLPPGRPLPSAQLWRDTCQVATARAVDQGYKQLTEEGFLIGSRNEGTRLTPIVGIITLADLAELDLFPGHGFRLAEVALRACSTAPNPTAITFRAYSYLWRNWSDLSDDQRIQQGRNLHTQLVSGSQPAQLTKSLRASAQHASHQGLPVSGRQKPDRSPRGR